MTWAAAGLLVAAVVVLALRAGAGGSRRASTRPASGAAAARWSTGPSRALTAFLKEGPASAQGARWATARDVRALADAPGPGRMPLGLVARGPLRPPRLLVAERAQSVTIVGPTQSGKTSCLALPAILSWEGPVLAASVKTDLLRDTASRRADIGRVWCFDPSRVTGRPAASWSPLPRCGSWSGARRAAADLTEVSKTAGASADSEFWYSMAAKMLAPLLFAAARDGRTMADVVRWVDRQEVAEVANLLEGAGCEEALQAAQANWLRDERQRSSVSTTAESVLEPFADGTLEDAGDAGERVDAEVLLDGSHTLYLCAPAHDQRRLVGLFTAVVKDVLEAAFTRSARRSAPLDPPLLVVLDEAANIAPLAELDGLAATAAGHGVQLVTVWQDLAQVSARYGERSATVVNNHRAKIFLPGISDPATLELASRLVGEEQRLVPSVTRDPTGGRSVTTGLSPQPLLPPDALRRLPAGHGVLVYGALPPVMLALRPWWEAPELRAGPAVRSCS